MKRAADDVVEVPDSGGRRSPPPPSSPKRKRARAIVQLSHFEWSDDERAQYWQACEARITEPHLRAHFERLARHNPLGVAVARSAASSDSEPPTAPALQCKEHFWRERRKQAQLYDVCEERISLVRVGAFYQAYGYDALVFAQTLGYQLMNNKAQVLVAGVHKGRLRCALARLAASRVEVAVVEQFATDKKGKYVRRLQQVITPSQPQYLYRRAEEAFEMASAGGGGSGSGDDGGDDDAGAACDDGGDDDYVAHDDDDDGDEDERPLLVVRANENDFALIAVYWQQRRAVTESCVRAVLDERLRELAIDVSTVIVFARRDAHSNALVAQLRAAIGCNVRLHDRGAALDSDAHCVEAVVSSYAHYLGDGQRASPIGAQQFDIVVRDVAGDACAPLSTTTAAQFGLVDGRRDGVEPLVANCLPRGARRHARNVLTDWFVRPPPLAIAAHIAAACALLERRVGAVPSVLPPQSAARYVVLLKERCARAGDVRQIDRMVRAATAFVCADENAALVGALLPIVAHQMRADVGDADAVVALLRQCAETTGVVRTDEREACSSSSSSTSTTLPPDYIEKSERRSFVNYVARSATPRLAVLHANVAACVRAIDAEAVRAFGAGVRLEQIARGKNKYMCARRASGAAGVTKCGEKYYACGAVTEAVHAYETALEATAACVRAYLQDLCDRVDVRAVQVAWHLLVVVHTLDAHVSECRKRRRWAASTVAAATATATGSGAAPVEPPPFALVDAWPYWMDAATAAKNTFEVNAGALVITGENEHGKTTLLRTTGAIALLATCGLYCPATAASVPPLRRIFMRTVSGDVAHEQMSTMARETHELAPITHADLADSLVLLDEVGHGTSHASAESLTVSLVMRCAMFRTARLVLSTHLSEIAQHPCMPAEHVTWKRMALRAHPRPAPVDGDGHGGVSSDGEVSYTYQLEDGVCECSMAYASCVTAGWSEQSLELYRIAARARSGTASGGGGGGGRPRGDAEFLTVRRVHVANTEADVLHAFRVIIAAEIAATPSGGGVADPDDLIDVCRVESHEMPPPLYADKHVCYLRLDVERMRWYVGETRNVRQRIEQHRSKHPDNVFFVAAVPNDATEVSLRVEQRFTVLLGHHVVVLDSEHDGFHRIHCK